LSSDCSVFSSCFTFSSVCTIAIQFPELLTHLRAELILGIFQGINQLNTEFLLSERLKLTPHSRINTVLITRGRTVVNMYFSYLVSNNRFYFIESVTSVFNLTKLKDEVKLAQFNLLHPISAPNSRKSSSNTFTRFL